MYLLPALHHVIAPTIQANLQSTGQYHAANSLINLLPHLLLQVRSQRASPLLGFNEHYILLRIYRLFYYVITCTSQPLNGGRILSFTLFL